MTLVPPQPDYQFIQSSTPSNAKKSDWWLDTSTSPPKSKVYDGSSFVRPEEVEFVDSRVSNAGATQSDIQSAILSDGTKFDGSNIDETISSRSDHSPSDVYNNVDSGVDWASKTPDVTSGSQTSTDSNIVNVSGSGYITGFIISDNDVNSRLKLIIDGNTVISNRRIREPGIENGNGRNYSNQNMLHRFDTSFSLKTGSFVNDTVRGEVSYVLD